MAQATYAVVRDGNFWTVKYDKQNYGRYKTQQEAVNNAIKTAHRVGENVGPSLEDEPNDTERCTPAFDMPAFMNNHIGAFKALQG